MHVKLISTKQQLPILQNATEQTILKNKFSTLLPGLI